MGARRRSQATLPRGELRLWVEQRYERWGPYGVARERDGTLYHLDGELFPVNRGAWSFWLDAAADGEQARVEAREMPSSWGRVSLRLGDHTAQRRGRPSRCETSFKARSGSAGRPWASAGAI